MRSLLPRVLIWLLSISSTLSLAAPRDANSTSDSSEKHGFIEDLIAQMTVPEMGVWYSRSQLSPELTHQQ